MMKSVMDAPATEEEREQAESLDRENRIWLEKAEQEIAHAKGERTQSEASPLAGAGRADVQERRWARGAFASEDYEASLPEEPAYNGPTTFAEITNHDELRSYVQHSESAARELHDGSDGLPLYDDAVSRYLVPFIKKQPAALGEILRADNVAEAAYSAALWLKGEHALPEGYENWDPDRFGDYLARRFQGGIDRELEKSPELLSKKELRRMNELKNPADFAACLDYLKLRGK